MAQPHGNREATAATLSDWAQGVYSPEALSPAIVRIPVPVRLPHDIVAWLDQLAEQQSEPRSVVIRHLLRAEMERQQRSRKRLPVITDGD